MKTDISPAAVCARRIALLSVLHSVPEQPSSNVPGPFPLPETSYTLPFDKERNLAVILAFLSNVKIDSEHVPALFVHEDRASQSLQVFIAINKTDAKDGREILKTLLEKFEKLFAVLAKIEKYGRSVTETALFAEIVSMCSRRILCRLRIVKNKQNRQKQAIKELLQSIIVAVQEGKHHKRLQATASRFLLLAKNIIKLFDQWSKYQKIASLTDLVEGFYELSQVAALKELVESIPRGILTPGTGKRLFNTIRKVGRYRESASILTRLAFKFPLLRRMTALAAQLPEACFAKLGMPGENTTFASSLQYPSILGPQNAGRIYQRLGKKKSEANDEFMEFLQRATRLSKIHAEVQLVYFCEMSNLQQLPRVICSCKDACYLCNQLISASGKFHIPRQHGRLYEKWRIPDIAGTPPFVTEFSQRLADTALRGLQKLLDDKRRISHSHPDESTVFTIPNSEYTVSPEPSLLLEPRLVSVGTVFEQPAEEARQDRQDKSGGAQKTKDTEENDVQNHRDLIQRTQDSQIKTAEQDKNVKLQEADTSVDENMKQVAELKVKSEFHEASQSVPTPPPTPKLALIPQAQPSLSQGQPARFIMDTSGLFRHKVGPIEVFVEYTTSNLQEKPSQTSTSAGLSYSMTWLSKEDATREQACSRQTIIDAEHLSEEMLIATDHSKSFIVTAGGAFLKMQIKGR